MRTEAQKFAYPLQQTGMVGKPNNENEVAKMRTAARRIGRMKLAHDKGRCWKRCVFDERT